MDLMFDGTDEDGRPFGVYVHKVKGSAFEYEICERFTEGERFLKASDSDYSGPETEHVEAGWEREFQKEEAARRSKSRSIDLKMGDVGFEPTTG